MADEVVTQTEVQTPAASDKLSFRMVVGCLSFVLVAIVGGWIALAYLGKTPPSELMALATGVLGALAGILSPIKV